MEKSVVQPSLAPSAVFHAALQTSTAPHQTSRRNVCNERSRWRGPRRAVGGVGKSVAAGR